MSELCLTLTYVLQALSVRETNRLLDSKVQQLQSQLHEQATNNSQARVGDICLQIDSWMPFPAAMMQSNDLSCM